MNASPVFRFKSALANCCAVPLACGLYTSPRFSEVKQVPVNTLPIGLWNFVNINLWRFTRLTKFFGPNCYSTLVPVPTLREGISMLNPKISPFRYTPVEMTTMLICKDCSLNTGILAFYIKGITQANGN